MKKKKKRQAIYFRKCSKTQCVELGYKFKADLTVELGLPWWLSGKEHVCQAGDKGLIRGLGRSPGEGNGNPFQYSCLGNLTNRGAWQATIHGVAKELDKT